MFDLFATILAWFYSFTHNYALAIALLTLCVMVILTPLTLKGTKSMLQLQRLQPEIRRLQQQHKGDRQKLNEEVMKFYQENKINPVGGCLPLLLQAPVFFILYRVLSGLTKRGEDGTFNPSYIDQSSELYRALDRQTEMVSFGIDLSQSAVKKLGESFVSGIPYLVLILLVAGTSYYQQRQISARNTSAADTPMARQQQLLMKIFPIFFAVISLTLPAGLVVYFLVSNTFRVAQQAYITHSFYKGEESLGRQASAAGAAARAAKDGDATAASDAPPSGAHSARRRPSAPSATKGNAAKGRAVANGDRASNGANGSSTNGRAAKPTADGSSSRPTPRRTPPKGRPTPSGRVTPPKPKPGGRTPPRPNPKKK